VLITKRKPASVGEILVKEFIEPFGLTQGDLAEAMGGPRLATPRSSHIQVTS